MITDIITKRGWNIPEFLEKQFSVKTLKNILRSLNRLSRGGYFFIDYFNKEIIVDNANSRILCGYPPDLAAQERLSFLNRIMIKDEVAWFEHLTQPIFDVFFTLDIDNRYNIICLYDMFVQPMKGDKKFLHCKTTPFQLCDNGNLWLLLCYISPSLSQESHNVCLIDTNKLIRYNLIDNSFVPSKILLLTYEEEQILYQITKNMQGKSAYETLDIHKSKYHRIRKSLFDKLEVTTTGGAVLRAHQLGII